jgi:hypothetical protein
MPEKVNWSYATEVVGGPTLAGSGELEVEAYLKLAVTVPAGGTLDVEVLPGGGGSVQLLVISPSRPGEDLSYKIGSEDVVLDGPHILVGAGAVGLLAASIGTLTFTNGGTEDTDISILAGRDATP